MTRNAPRPSRQDLLEWALVCAVVFVAFLFLSGALAVAERFAWWR